MLQEENLFGVEHGSLVGLTLDWAQNHLGKDQLLKVTLAWGNRVPSTIVVYIPDDHQISAYVSAFMDLTMNGPWLGKRRLAVAVHKATTRCVDLGAEVVTRGTKLPRI